MSIFPLNSAEFSSTLSALYVVAVGSSSEEREKYSLSPDAWFDDPFVAHAR